MKSILGLGGPRRRQEIESRSQTTNSGPYPRRPEHHTPLSFNLQIPARRDTPPKWNVRSVLVDGHNYDEAPEDGFGK